MSETPKAPPSPIARPKRAAIQPTLELALGDLLSTVDPERYPAAVADRLRQLFPLPLERLEAGDLFFLLGQGIGASLVVPLALEQLERDPLLVAEHGRGDLLSAVFGPALPQVVSRVHLRARARLVLAAAERRLYAATAARGHEQLLAVVRQAADAFGSGDSGLG